MSTYEFQLNAPQDQYQTQISQHGPPILTPASMATPGPSSTPGAASTPQPIIIQYDANQGRHPYGTGDHEEGFDLEFENLAAFNAWKLAEEDNNCLDYFKVDSHTSKAVPPRFKEHTKLACSRHARAGQKKYVKKFPERPRKTPSKKLEGIGCPSTICYKTYFESPIVRVSYVSHHSHEIGEANFPFTKKYRRQKSKSAHNIPFSKEETPIKSIAESAFDKLHSDAPSTPTEQQHHFQHQPAAGPSLPPSPPASMQDPSDLHQMEQVSYPGMSRINASYEQSISSHDTSSPIPHPPISPSHPQQHHIQRSHSHHVSMNSHDQNQIYNPPREHPPVAVHNATRDAHPPMPMHTVPQPYHQFHRSIDHQQQQQHGRGQPPLPPREAHLPPLQSQTHPLHPSLPHPSSQPPSRPSLSQHNSNQSHSSISQQGSNHSQIPSHAPMAMLPDRRQLTQERWDRMENLFAHIRRHAATSDFADSSVSALEMLLLRLFLETPSNTQGSGPSPYPGPHPPDHQQGPGQNMIS